MNFDVLCDDADEQERSTQCVRQCQQVKVREGIKEVWRVLRSGRGWVGLVCCESAIKCIKIKNVLKCSRNQLVASLRF